MRFGANYTKAIEQRLRWLRWSKDEAYKVLGKTEMVKALPMYEQVLENGPTFCMNATFGEMVNQAQSTIPDDLCFDEQWMLAKQGWIWLDTPLKIPAAVMKKEDWLHKYGKEIDYIPIVAVGWYPLPEGFQVIGFDNKPLRKAGKGAYEFIFFEDLKTLGPNAPDGFGCWSYCMVQHGERVGDRIESFEKYGVRDSKEGGVYNLEDPLARLNHEIRWLFAALSLMAQKLAVTVDHTNRPLKRRFEREQVSLAPLVRVVTLRRLEEDRKRDPKGNQIDWQWQWRVSGHGRWQWYPSEQDHKWIWIEDYIKGPQDKPLKPPQHTIYVAGR